MACRSVRPMRYGTSYEPSRYVLCQAERDYADYPSSGSSVPHWSDRSHIKHLVKPDVNNAIGLFCSTNLCVVSCRTIEAMQFCARTQSLLHTLWLACIELVQCCLCNSCRHANLVGDVCYGVRSHSFQKVIRSLDIEGPETLLDSPAQAAGRLWAVKELTDGVDRTFASVLTRTASLDSDPG